MGDPTNVRVWNRIDVYLGIVADPATPVDGDADLAPTDWDLVGLISPDGFEDTPEISNEKIKDYTGKTIRVVNNEYTRTIAFTAMESNDVVRQIAYPGSDATQDVVPEFGEIALALELFDGTLRERRIVAGTAQVINVEPVTKTRAAADTVKVTVEIVPDAAGVLFDKQTGTVS